MYEKIVSDRIADEITQLAYSKAKNIKINISVVINRGMCTINAQTNAKLRAEEISDIVHKYAGRVVIRYYQTKINNPKI